MKIVRLAIFLTGVMGLAMGGLTTISSLKTSQEEAVVRTNENLKSQGALFVDQFYGTLEAIKALSVNATSLPGYVTHRAVLKLNQGIPAEFVSFTSNEQKDPGLEDRVMAALKKTLSMGDLQILKISLGTFGMTDTGNKEGIFVATPVYKVVNGITDPNLIEQVNIALVDPVRAFGGLQKLGSTEQTAFLIDKKGKVLAHTVTAFVGTDLTKTDHLKDQVENLFLGAQTGTVTHYTGVDGAKEQVAFVRAGTYPFAFAVEQKAMPAVLSSAWISDQLDSGAARKNLGWALVALALALASFSAISIFASKKVSEQIAENSTQRKENANEVAMPNLAPHAPYAQITNRVAPSLAARGSSYAAAAPSAYNPALLDQAASAFVENRAQLNAEMNQAKVQASVISANRDYARDFVAKIEKGHTLEGVEKELVSVSSELSESPVLYFRYHRRNQSLTLSAVAGEVKIPNYTLMQAYVRKDIELQVEQLADDGKVASISNYGPMSKLIISHLNVAHFEAWAVTSSPEVSTRSKLVGVMVVLQAGIKSAQARPVLAKILKESGNYLYAQSNKIRPRSSVYQATQTPVLEDTNGMDGNSLLS